MTDFRFRIMRALVMALFGILTFFTPSALAQETSLQIGLNPNIPGQSIRGLDTTTDELDSNIRRFGIVGRLGFGQNPVRDLTNTLFSEVGALESDLESLLFSRIQDEPDVRRVRFIDLNLDSPRITISQNAARVVVVISNIGGRGAFDGQSQFLCGVPRISFSISSLSIRLEYDALTGRTLQGRSNIGFANVDTDCTGVFGGIAEVFVDEDGIARRRIENAVVNALMPRQVTTDFAIQSLAETIERVLVDIPPVPVFGTAARDDALEALRRLNAMLSSNTFQGSGLTVELAISRRGRQSIRLVLGHDSPRVTSAEYISGGTLYEIDEGFNTGSIQFFTFGSGGWRRVDNNPRGFARIGTNGYFIRGARPGTSVAAIARSRIDANITSETLQLPETLAPPRGCTSRVCRPRSR